MFLPLHAAPAVLSGKSSMTSSSVYLGSLNLEGDTTGSKPTPSGGVITVASHQTGLNSHYAGLPGWAWLLIGIAGAIAILFSGAFAYFAVDERRKSRAQNRTFSTGRAVWKAAKIALFLWVFIALAKLVTCRSRRARRAGVSSYHQVSDEKTKGFPRTSMSGGLSGGLSSVSITGGPTYQAYGDGGSGRRALSPRAAAAGRFEPFKGDAAAAPISAFQHQQAASTEYRSTTTVPSITGGSYPTYSDGGPGSRAPSPLPATAYSSSMPLMAGAYSYLGGSSRPSSRDPSPAPSATYVPGREGSYGMH